MKEHPIIITTSLIPAVLEDRKTQTRRVINPQPCKPSETSKAFCWKGTAWIGKVQISDLSPVDLCPYGQVGDRLLIKETHKLTRKSEGIICQYKDGEERYFKRSEIPLQQRARLRRIKTWGRWRSPRFMYNFLVRHKVEITNVRVERLQEIGFRDCEAEGIYIYADPWKAKGLSVAQVRMRFANLWDSLNAKYKWESNPWVWVIEFRRLISE